MGGSLPSHRSHGRQTASGGPVEVVPGVGVDFGAVGSEHAELLMVEGVGPVAVLVDERVVSSTQRLPLSCRWRRRVPRMDVVDVAPGGGDLTAGPLAVGDCGW